MMQKLWMQKRDGVIALAVLIVVFLLLALLALNPVFSHVERYRAELRKDARVLQQLRAVDAARDALESTFQEYEEKGLQTWVYSQEQVDGVALDIQRRVSAELTQATAQVKTISPLPVKMQADYSAVGVKVDFSASMSALMEVLNALEQGKPLLVVDNLRITPARARSSRGGDFSEQTVDVQMTVLTLLMAQSSAGAVQ